MKRIYLLLFCLSVFFGARAQSSDALIKEIDLQVWIPFIQAFNTQDTDKFMAVHSASVSRVIQDANLIWDYKTYYQNTLRNNKDLKEAGAVSRLELRFLQRIVNPTQSMQTGYFKTTMTRDGKTMTFYGKFHVLLHKENGKWKIVMDADKQDNVTEEIFQTATPIL